MPSEFSILDYSDFVEMACEEQDAAYSSYPSIADVNRNALRFIDPKKIPKKHTAIPKEYQDIAFESWREYYLSRDDLFGKWHYFKNCHYCKTELVDIKTNGLQLPSNIEKIIARECPNCGWWEAEEELPVSVDDETGSYSGRSIHRRAILREFDVAGSDVPIDSLRRHIIKHPNILHSINPYSLEKLVGDVFSEHMDCNAIHVGGPNDGGIDIILVDGKRRYVVQVKRRMYHDSVESVSGIREFVGAMVLHGTLKGLFVSTASRFSRSAQETANKAKEKGILEYIELVDGNKLKNLCRLSKGNSTPNWTKNISKPKNLLIHVNPGFHAFMEHAMGHKDWKIAY
jgi:hypothetical protein